MRVGKLGANVELFGSVSSIWNRRPGKPFDFVAQGQRPSMAVQQFASDQWFACLEAVELLPDALWVNHPVANARMESKVRQLHQAAEMGFSVPKTLITNRLEDVRAFCAAEGGRLVAKALYSPLIEESNQDYFVFSNIVTASDLRDEAGIEISPTIFQEVLAPKADYRVTVIGENVFPVRITSDSPVQPLDWRTRGNDVNYARCELPPDVAELCRTFVKSSKLVFGAIDLVEHDGRFYFLEINPNGEWGWLEKTVGVPIASALCDLLQHGLEA